MFSQEILAMSSAQIRIQIELTYIKRPLVLNMSDKAAQPPTPDLSEHLDSCVAQRSAAQFSMFLFF